MQSSWWLRTSLTAVCFVSTADAQIFHVSSDARQVYGLAKLQCGLQQEQRRTPSAPGAPFDQSVRIDLEGCNPNVQAFGNASQVSAIFADSLYILAAASGYIGSYHPLSLIAKSDASIQFSLDAGRWYSFVFDIVENCRSSFGTAIADLSLSLLASRGGEIDAVHVQIGDDPMHFDDRREYHLRGILESGDYDLEVHARADIGAGLSDDAALEIGLKIRVIPTAVEETSWGTVKSLFR